MTVFHGDRTSRQVRAIKRARVILEEIGLTSRFVEVGKPWNIEEGLRAIFSEYRRDARPREVIVNASGGTEVLNAAATFFGLLTGSPLRYVDRHSWKAYTIDCAKIMDVLSLDERKRRLIEAVMERGGSMEVSRLPEELGVTPGAVSQQLRFFNSAGLVEVHQKPKGRGKLATLSPDLWALQLLWRPKRPVSADF